MAQVEITTFRDSRNIVGESPLWDRQRNCLWWVDTPAHEIWRADLESATNEVISGPREPAALALDAAGDLIIAAGASWHRMNPETGDVTILATTTPRPDVRFNDGVVDAAGRFWTGTLHAAREPVGELLCLSDAGTQAAASGLRTQNGCAISPDGRRFYLADSHPDIRAIYVFDFDMETGTLSDRRLFHRPALGRPDGAAMDAQGCYWFAAIDAGRVVQLDPEGREMRAIALPTTRPTKPAFGGDDLSTLFVTSMRMGVDVAREPLAGAVFAIETGSRGLHQPRVTSAPPPDVQKKQEPLNQGETP